MQIEVGIASTTNCPRSKAWNIKDSSKLEKFLWRNSSFR
jgi:hypothetical protein